MVFVVVFGCFFCCFLFFLLFFLVVFLLLLVFFFFVGVLFLVFDFRFLFCCVFVAAGVSFFYFRFLC